MSEAEVKATTKPKMASIEATIFRADGTIEHLGTIAYYHCNPLRRLLWAISQWFKRRR